MSKIEGRYQSDKSNLVKPGIHLVIGTRRQPTPAKPKHYLLFREGSSHKYLSSLYPTPDPTKSPTTTPDPYHSPTGAQIWHFDYQGCKYVLSIQPGGMAEIKPCKEGADSTSL